MLAEWSKEVLPKSCYIFLYLYLKSRQNTQQMRVKIPTKNEAISIISIPLSDHIELIYAIKIQQKLLKWFKDVFLSFENSIRGMGLGLCSKRLDGKHSVCTHCREYISFVNIDSSQTFENLPVIRTCIAFRDEGIRWELWVFLYSPRGSNWEEISWWLITGYHSSYNIHRPICMVESCFSLYIIIFLCINKASLLLFFFWPCHGINTIILKVWEGFKSLNS